MAKTVNMLEAKSTLSRLVDTVERGDEREIIIARDGKPAARLVALASARVGKRLGVAKGAFVVPDDIDVSNDDVRALLTSG